MHAIVRGFWHNPNNTGLIACDSIYFLTTHFRISKRISGLTSRGALHIFNTIFVSSHMYPENPEGTQVFAGSMNMRYISGTARNRTHNLFRPKREPITLCHSDGFWCVVVAYSVVGMSFVVVAMLLSSQSYLIGGCYSVHAVAVVVCRRCQLHCRRGLVVTLMLLLLLLMLFTALPLLLFPKSSSLSLFWSCYVELLSSSLM